MPWSAGLRGPRSMRSSARLGTPPATPPPTRPKSTGWSSSSTGWRRERRSAAPSCGAARRTCARCGPRATTPCNWYSTNPGAWARIDHVHLELLLEEPCHLDKLSVTFQWQAAAVSESPGSRQTGPRFEDLAGLRPCRRPAQPGTERGDRVREADCAPRRGDTIGAERPGAGRLLPIPDRPVARAARSHPAPLTFTGTEAAPRSGPDHHAGPAMTAA